MMARDAMRRTAARILMAQAAISILIAALFLIFGSRVQSLSALVGGMIALIANAYMTLTVLRTSTRNAAGALGRLVFGQMVKVMLTVGGLLIVAKGGWAEWPPLLIAYAAALFVYWLVPVIETRPRRPKD
jgi:ATP synthase protein I